MASVGDLLNADGQEELWRVIKSGHPDAVSNALCNKGLTEQMAVFIAKNRRTPRNLLSQLAEDVRFKNSYRLKLSICRNPLTPRKVTLGLLKFVKIFDLAEISKDQLIDINVRQKTEYLISERIPFMAMGIKTALAKRAGPNTLLRLVETGDERVVRACLDNPLLTEGDIYKFINRPGSGGVAIRLIAEHKKWGLRYAVRFALIRNFHTPMTMVTKFISSMKLSDLEELRSDPQTPLSTRPFLHRELIERGTGAGCTEEIYLLSGDEDAVLSEREPETGNELPGDGM